jgi:hypothetical protein
MRRGNEETDDRLHESEHYEASVCSTRSLPTSSDRGLGGMKQIAGANRLIPRENYGFYLAFVALTCLFPLWYAFERQRNISLPSIDTNPH